MAPLYRRKLTDVLVIVPLLLLLFLLLSRVPSFLLWVSLRNRFALVLRMLLWEIMHAYITIIHGSRLPGASCRKYTPFSSSRNAFHTSEMRAMTKEKISRTTNRYPTRTEWKNYQLWFLYSKARTRKDLTIKSSVTIYLEKKAWCLHIFYILTSIQNSKIVILQYKL